MVKRARGGGHSAKNVRTGIAISSTALCAVDQRLPSGDRVWRAPLDPPPSDNGPWPSLVAALSDLARAIGGATGTLSISLVPPLTEVRRIEFPPVREEDVQRVLTRSASRYFVGARTPQIVGASLAGRRARGAPTQIIAAAAPARLVAAIRAAADASGWTVDVIAPAEGAWAAAALELWPAFARQRAHVLVAHEDRTDLLELQDGMLAGVRRFRAGASDAPVIADAVGHGARIGALGSSIPRKQLGASLSSLGISLQPQIGDLSNMADDAPTLAAHFAGRELGPVLRSEDAMVAERAKARNTIWRVAGAAAALFVLAAALELWGVHHQLNIVREERARIHPEISSTMVGRTTVEATYRHLATLNGIDRNAPHWSTVIGTVSDALPDDAFLLALRTRDDSVIVDGLADHAARVFDALEKTSSLVGVKATAPVRRELQDNGTVALEHFTIAARVSAPTSGATTTAASNPTSGDQRR